MKTDKTRNKTMRKEYDFSKGQRGRYAGRIKPGDTVPRNIKVRVTMFLDADVVEHFKKRAAKPNAAPYQTQINSALRESMERNEGATAHSHLIEDEYLISALADRVSERLAQANKKRKT
jgi:uncharacterized protein (DUF4415 family)